MKVESPAKILIVDDRPENLLALEVILDKKNYEIVRATSGTEALKILMKEPDFALILIDALMPIMDGFETANMIRQSEKLKYIPTIFLTAQMKEPDNILKGFQAGAVDYMLKPLQSEILRAKVAVFVELYRKNIELAFENEEKEKRAEELSNANKKLLAFTYIASHDLQEPLRKIQTIASIVLENETLSENGKHNLERMQSSAGRMRLLIDDLLAFSLISTSELKFERTELSAIVEEVKAELKDTIQEKRATVQYIEQCPANIIRFQFRQLMYNLISNALKFSKADIPPHITIKSRLVKGSKLSIEDNRISKLAPEKNYCHITVKDNGIGFDPQFSERIFGVFQKLHRKDIYAGTGIGLAIVKQIVENHNGIITATSELNKGATFDIYIPDN